MKQPDMMPYVEKGGFDKKVLAGVDGGPLSKPQPHHEDREKDRTELEDEKHCFFEGCPRDWDELPAADEPITVRIDGGYMRKWDHKKKNFEVIVGKSVPAEGQPMCFGLVQTLDKKPKRRVYEVLKTQGMQMNQKVFFLSDGGTAVRELQYYFVNYTRQSRRLP